MYGKDFVINTARCKGEKDASLDQNRTALDLANGGCSEFEPYFCYRSCVIDKLAWITSFWPHPVYQWQVVDAQKTVKVTLIGELKRWILCQIEYLREAGLDLPMDAEPFFDRFLD